MARDDPPRSEFLRKPKWRTRTSPALRGLGVAVTFASIVAAGLAIMILVMIGVDRVGAPDWFVALPWIVPTVGMLAWAIARPGPAVLSDDDEHSWIGFSIRTVMVGRDRARPIPLRVITAVLFGAPIVWSFVVFGIAELLGAF